VSACYGKADLVDLLCRVGELARDPSRATPQALQAVQESLAWAGQAQIKPRSVAAAALAECRRRV